MDKKYTTPIFAILFISCTIAFLIPVWFFRFPPLVDYPQHLAIAHIFHNYSEAGNHFQDYYLVKYFPVAYLLHSFFLHFMSFLFTMETAGKLYLSLYIILLPLSILKLIKAFNGEKWFSLFAFLFIYNFPFFMGFLAFFMTIPLFFFGLASLTNYARHNGAISRKDGLLLAGLFILISLTHAIFYFPLLGFFVITLIFTHKKGIKGYQAFAWALPSLIFMAYYYFNRWGLSSLPLFNETPSFSSLLPNIISRAKALGLNSLWPLSQYDTVFKLFFMSFGTLFLYGAIRKRKLFTPLSPLIIIWLFLSFLAYLTLPHAFSNHSYIFSRFATLTPLLLIVLLSAIKLIRIEKIIFALCLAGFLAFTLNNIWSGFDNFNKNIKPLPEMVSSIPKNEKVIGLYYSKGLDPRAFHPWAYMHLSCYYTVWKDSIPVYIFADDLPINIIEKREHIKKWGAHPFYETWNPHTMIIPKGWQNYDYFLAYGAVPPDHRLFFDDHNISLIHEDGIWALFKAP